jgi:cysteine synthase
VAAGVICSSAGNHAQGVALSARRRGVRAVIEMPVTTPRIKVDAVRTLGGEVVLHGDAYDDAYAHARLISERESRWGRSGQVNSEFYESRFGIHGLRSIELMLGPSGNPDPNTT